MHVLWLAALVALGQPAPAHTNPTFGEDADFLARHAGAFVLQLGASQVVVAGEYQGRVMTSTWGGRDGFSVGWINRRLIASGQHQPHINVFGGEDRFWLGPEGGQFALFFKSGAKYTVDNWQTPAPIDSEPYNLLKKGKSWAEFEKSFELTNKSGTRFHIRVLRRVEVLDRANIDAFLGVRLPDSVQAVGYQTKNTVTNVGTAPWTKKTGLVSIWILGMYKPSPKTTICIPIEWGAVSALGPAVTDTYFGKVPAARLKVTKNAIFFKGDGKMRGKIGVNPKRSEGLLGSYDAANRVLTVVMYNVPRTYVGYVNNLWENQKNPYSGDAIMAYNDGPLAPGKPPLGPFYELETSSPALALKPHDSYTHYHRTFHLHGSVEDLAALAHKIFGVELNEIQDALK